MMRLNVALFACVATVWASNETSNLRGSCTPSYHVNCMHNSQLGNVTRGVGMRTACFDIEGTMLADHTMVPLTWWWG